MTSWHSYPSIFAIGHRALAELLLDPVIVEEKVDGSQFSFGVFTQEPGTDGDECPPPELRVRSKGATMISDAPEKMFTKAVESVRQRAALLHPNWTYRAEYLAKPKHNALTYNRVPEGHLMVFDINMGHEEYMSYADKAAECKRVGLECVPLVYEGRIESAEQFRAMLDRESALGGPKIEGVVVKNYGRFGADKKALMGKFVSEAFKEIHSREWKDANPGQKDVLTKLVDELRSPQRWAKAVQHLRERGALTDSPRDIGPLIHEVQADIRKEAVEHVAERLVAWAMPHVMRGAVGGLPEWYKEALLKRQFEQQP